LAFPLLILLPPYPSIITPWGALTRQQTSFSWILSAYNDEWRNGEASHLSFLASLLLLPAC
jgi:hypothetical protein